MRAVRALCAVALSAAALVAAGAATQSASAAGALDIFFQYPNAIKGEHISPSGTIPSGGVRTVKLQYRSGTTGVWTTKLTTKSAPNGYFYFQTTDTRTHYWRYVVPAGGGKPAITGTPKKLPVVSQKVEYFGVTRSCDNTGHNIVSAWADFFPARQGRPVKFSTPEGDRTVVQDGRGVAHMDVVTDGGGTVVVHGTALVFDAAPAKSTGNASVSLPICALP
ncbi:hypothetical protein [Aeromicrobium ginsengisoli]|uniref:Uncharacterized protein n=1 Tax=Aeromicrobium ginsengisoli TaxID=363867 RepID=A0A5M4FDE2_9ACTN|nr:hypothetical protein [Aeromicrobium ginsengisoli]KAA1397365.1 hypothetical protein ESP70_008225 [Aeromicrobium ginsengisoli]